MAPLATARTPLMPTDPKALLAGPLRRAGIADADIIATEQVALLRGHHLLADDNGGRRRPAKPSAPIQRCNNPVDPHPGIELVNNHCPACGWSPNP